MRFGSHSHDNEPRRKESKSADERERLSRLLRDMADRIDRANFDRLGDGLASVATAAETLVRTVERVLGTKR